MSTGRAIALLTVVFAGCTLRGTPRAPAPAVPPPPRLVQPAPGPPPRHLACIRHPQVDLWERRLRSTQFRAQTRQTLERATNYLPRVRRILAKAGLPPSLALLPVVESEFRRTARGRFGDVGVWQFRGPTAQRFGLVVNERRDQRLHPYHASRAAARYLRFLHRRYRDWPLALAAYNAGEHRVDRARSGRRNRSFWDLAEGGHLPRTSRDFVPRFLAVVRVVEGKEFCRTQAGQAPTRGPLVVDPALQVTLTHLAHS